MYEHLWSAKLLNNPNNLISISALIYLTLPRPFPTIQIVSHMASTGTTFKRGAVPVKVEPEGQRVDAETGEQLPRYKVTWRNGDGALLSDVYDTVVSAASGVSW